MKSFIAAFLIFSPGASEADSIAACVFESGKVVADLGYSFGGALSDGDGNAMQSCAALSGYPNCCKVVARFDLQSDQECGAAVALLNQGESRVVQWFKAEGGTSFDAGNLASNYCFNFAYEQGIFNDLGGSGHVCTEPVAFCGLGL